MCFSLQLPTALLLLYICTSVHGTSYSFVSEPEQYYYAFPDHAQLIPCEGIETRDDGTEVPVDVVIYKNSARINSDRPPNRLFPISTNGFITGILITPIMLEDSGSTYQCVVEVNKESVLNSSQTTLYVGDGRPLAPVANPGQMGETLTTVSIVWGESPVPTSAPLQGYTVVIAPIEGNSLPYEVETVDNKTEIELFQLTPGHNYTVQVFGRNSNGNGTASIFVRISTVKPVAPHTPQEVEAVLVKHDTSFSINVSWTLSEFNEDTMTPIDNYIIFYGTAKMSSSLAVFQNVTTSDNTTTLFTLYNIIVPGNYSVGVAAVNSAGMSPVTFYEEFLELPSMNDMTALPAVLTPQVIIAIGVVGTSVLLILTIAILLLLIMYIMRKTRQMTAVDLNHPDGGSVKSDNSPSSKRKGHSSPKIKPSPLHSNGVRYNVELNDYEVEPRRAGSQSPERFDLEESTGSMNGLSASTFMDNSLKV